MKKVGILIIASLFFTCQALFTAGCGYTTSAIISSGAKSIHINNFVNRINLTEEPTDKRMYIAYKSGMELDITRQVIDRFIMDGNLKVISADEADLTLNGELIDFLKEPLRYDTNDNITEYRVKIVVNLTLLNRRDNKVIWEEKNFTGEATYKLAGEYAKSEGLALDDAAGDLAMRIVERTVEGW